MNTLFNGIVAADLAFVGGAVAAVLAVVTHLLVSGAVITRRFDLADDERRGRNAEGESEDGEDVEEHGY